MRGTPGAKKVARSHEGNQETKREPGVKKGASRQEGSQQSRREPGVQSQESRREPGVKTQWVKTQWVKTQWVKTQWVKTQWVKTQWVKTQWVKTLWVKSHESRATRQEPRVKSHESRTTRQEPPVTQKKNLPYSAHQAQWEMFRRKKEKKSIKWFNFSFIFFGCGVTSKQKLANRNEKSQGEFQKKRRDQKGTTSTRDRQFAWNNHKERTSRSSDLNVELRKIEFFHLLFVSRSFI